MATAVFKNPPNSPTQMVKQLFAGLLVFCCCLTLLNAEPRQETEAFPFGHAFSVNFNPIDFVYPQQLQQRLYYEENCYSGQRVVYLCQQVLFMRQSLAAIAASLRSLRRDFYASLAQLTQMITNVANDVSSILQRLPKCPSTAPAHAKVLGTYCYWIGTTKKTLGDASTDCRAGGGTLAEPLPALGPPLYTALLSAFPDQFATIGATSNLWLGIDNYDDKATPPLINKIIYLTTNQYVPGVLNPVKPDLLMVHYGAILTTTSTFNYMSFPTLNNYVCQSTAL